MDISKSIKSVFDQFGFKFRNEFSRENHYVFSIKQGFFNNAVIVTEHESEKTDEIYNELKKLGFAVQVYIEKSVEKIEQNLFSGFFDVQNSKKLFEEEYKEYTEKVLRSFPSNPGSYSYIKTPFISSKTEDQEQEQESIIEEIFSDLESNGPKLILVEAAAGFGKTSTAYELGKKICSEFSYKIPLLAELSRDRKAKTFRHILLNEIDRRYPSLSSSLVTSEIKKNRVITILDGFDELLSDKEEGDSFDKSEAMLETIAELLTHDSKIILTTRKTAVLEGDDFYNWMEAHFNDFDVIRYSLLEPQVGDWLDYFRIDSLRSNNLDPETISNPVLLSYLKYLPDEKFLEICSKPDQIVEIYFNSMLEREQERQELRMSIEEQEAILLSISYEMVNGNFTKDSRENITKSIIKSNSELIDKVRSTYSPTDRPTREELCNTLANHALLDRSSSDEKIGFVNDFVLGHFVAKQILIEEEWLGDEIFIESAITSYMPRTKIKKDSLWLGLTPVMGALHEQDAIKMEYKLNREIHRAFSGATFKGISFEGAIFSSPDKIMNCVFSECIFRGCSFDFSTIEDNVFVGCRFYECTHRAKGEYNHFLNCHAEKCSFDIERQTDEEGCGGEQEDDLLYVKRYILEKFWPTGKESITYAHRPLSMLYGKKLQGITSREIDDALSQLRKCGIIVDAKKKNWVGLNTALMSEIAGILGR